jgi:hypothetical protein
MALTRSSLGCAFVLLASAQAFGQTGPAPAAPAGARWEIELHGGVSSTGRPQSGSITMPPAGAPILTSSPIFPSRQVSTWFAGDGASLLNEVSAELRLTPRLTPLDAALESIGLDSATGAGFGARLRRALTRRLVGELSVDLLTRSAGVTDEFADAVASSATSFETTFAAVFATGPFGAPLTSASLETSAGSRRDLAITGTINYHFDALGAFVPYLSFGGGVIAGAGTLPSATLAGSYRFTLPSGASVSEADRVTLRFDQRTTFAGVVGGGLRRSLSDTWSLQIDGRVLLGPAGTRVLLDASPTTTAGAPADFIESLTYPSLQFSNNQSTGRHSTLSGAALDGVEVFTASGLETRVLVTVGVFWKF